MSLKLTEHETALVSNVSDALVSLCHALKAADAAGVLIEFSITNASVSNFKIRKTVKYPWPTLGKEAK